MRPPDVFHERVRLQSAVDRVQIKFIIERTVLAVWKSTSASGVGPPGGRNSIATLSSMLRVDGVEDDAMIQHDPLWT